MDRNAHNIASTSSARLRHLGALVFLGSLSACIDIDLSGLSGFGSGYDCAGCGGTNGPTGNGTLYIRPAFVRMLKGDTVRFSTARCPSYNSTCETVPALWHADSVAAFVGGGGLDTSVASGSDVLVRAVAPGAMRLSAVHVGTTDSAAVSVLVADSSAITEVAVLRMDQARDTVAIDGKAWFHVRLFVGSDPVRAAPTALSVSDTSVLRITKTELRDFGFLVTVTGVRQGYAELRIEFLGLSKAVQLTVP